MTELSPATQAVRAAAQAAYWLPDQECPGEPDAIAAAALRAAVWQCVYMDDYGTDLVNAEELRAIAIELEANR